MKDPKDKNEDGKVIRHFQDEGCDSDPHGKVIKHFRSEEPEHDGIKYFQDDDDRDDYDGGIKHFQD